MDGVRGPIAISVLDILASGRPPGIGVGMNPAGRPLGNRRPAVAMAGLTATGQALTAATGRAGAVTMRL